VEVVVLVPAYNPDGKLPAFVDALVAAGFRRIVVVDDGSAPASLPAFERVGAHPECTVLTHAVNLGKGRAIKTGLNHILQRHPDAAGVVTADADGQHLARDVAAVVETFRAHPDALVLGARRFGPGTPRRSLVGNLVTRHLFRLLVGRRISDTQSGLRCFPRSLVPELLRLEGERYEYEMNMLLSIRDSTPVVERGIETVYIEENRSSHFDPVYDSMKISFLLLRFTVSSVFTSMIDFLVFALAYSVSGSLLASIAVARGVAGNINFFVNRRLVFRSRERVAVVILKYYTLLALLGTFAYGSIKTLADDGLNVIAAKILVESLLFLANFSIQQNFIFTGRRGHGA
jgi:glycosyltransferase involved in cell wall biosynthesis